VRADSYAILAISALTFLGVALGRWPGLRTNRASIALVGAAALVGIGGLSLEEAFGSLDLHTLTLLFSVMVLNANLRLSGFFGWVAAATMRVAHSARMLLAVLLGTSGLLSALFLNDTICLMLTPLVVDVARRLGRDPIPYLVGLALSANIGSVATVTGNPQNMLVAMSGGLAYVPFALALTPVALLGLLLAWVVLVLVYREEFRPGPLPPPPDLRVRFYRPLLVKSLLATAALLAMFLAGVPVAQSALLASAGLLVTRRLKPERIFADFDWQLLVLFAGLFMVTGALEHGGWTRTLGEALHGLAGRGLGGLMVLTALLSNLVSNVPAVLLLRPMIPGTADPQKAWLAVAAASTLAGNFTLLGSMANLIVAEQAARRRVRLSFGAYLKAGVPVTLLTLLVAWLWLTFVLP